MKQRTETVRDRILEAALSLVSRVGARGLAQPQVAKEAGVPQGHLTYYFPKKIDLLSAVAERFIETLRAELGAPFASVFGPSMRERAMSFAAKLAIDRARTRTLLGLVAESEQDVVLRARVVEKVTLLKGVVAKLIDREADDPDVDIALAAMWGLGLQHLMFEGHRTDSETEARFRRLLAWFDAMPRGESVTRRDESGPAG